MSFRRTPLALLIGLAVVPAATAQSVFWTETFENGCCLVVPTSTCNLNTYSGANGAWTIQNIGAQGSGANTWYVSGREAGGPQGACGSDCNVTGSADESLHVANVPASPNAPYWCPDGDCGAAYDAGDGSGSVITNRRAVSPLISTVGRAGISVRFIYIGGGQPCADACDFEYSVNGGGAWLTVAGATCLTTNNAGCGGQGRWTERIVVLPASANDIPNLRIGFRWHNDDDTAGADPSWAVDDVQVRQACATPLPPIPMDIDNDLRASKSGGNVLLDWTLMGAPGPATTHYHVYRSTSPSAAFPWTQIAGDSPRLTAQTYADAVLADGVTYYYDVRSADDCESICPKQMNVAIGSNAPSCSGSGVVDFVSQVSGGQPPFTYSWNFGDFTPLGTTPNPSHTYVYPPNTRNVSLTVTDSSIPVPQSVVDNETVGIGPGTLDAIATQNSPMPVGEQVTFTATPSGGVSPYTFAWSFGDGATSTLQNPFHAYAAQGTYNASVVVKDAIGCTVTRPLTVTITP